MKCPICHENLVRQRGETTELFVRKLILRKGADATEAVAVCPRCKAHVAVPADAAAILAKSVFLARVKEAMP